MSNSYSGTGGAGSPTVKTSADGGTVSGNTTITPDPTLNLVAGSGITLDGTSTNTLKISSSGGGGGGTVTSVAVSGGTTGLTTSGGPITTSGTITIAGTLAISNGGTGATSASGARTNLGLGSTDNVTFNNVEIDGNLNHDGNNIGFFGTTPTTEETVDGPLTQGFNPAAATPNETALAGAIDSLGQALANYGFITYNP